MADRLVAVVVLLQQFPSLGSGGDSRFHASLLLFVAEARPGQARDGPLGLFRLLLGQAFVGPNLKLAFTISPFSLAYPAEAQEPQTAQGPIVLLGLVMASPPTGGSRLRC